MRVVHQQSVRVLGWPPDGHGVPAVVVQGRRALVAEADGGIAAGNMQI